MAFKLKPEVRAQREHLAHVVDLVSQANRKAVYISDVQENYKKFFLEEAEKYTSGAEFLLHLLDLYIAEQGKLSTNQKEESKMTMQSKVQHQDKPEFKSVSEYEPALKPLPEAPLVGDSYIKPSNLEKNKKEE